MNIATSARGGSARPAIHLQRTGTTSFARWQSAVVLQCMRRIGGWPQVALVGVDRRPHLSRGRHPDHATGDRTIDWRLSGRTSATAATLPQSAADSLLRRPLGRTRVQRRRRGPIRAPDGARCAPNLAENFAAAETAYRGALALQQRSLGRDNPDTVTALMHLARRCPTRSALPRPIRCSSKPRSLHHAPTTRLRWRD